MNHVQTPRCNMTYRGDGDQVGDLSCRREQPGQVASWWRPSRDELALLNAGGLVRLDVWTEPIPPLSVGVEAFPVDPDTPVLGLAVPFGPDATLDGILATVEAKVRDAWAVRQATLEQEAPKP